MKQDKQKGYVRALLSGLGTALSGLRVTARHLKQGLEYPEPLGIDHPDYFKQAEKGVTIQYPQQQSPVPPNGRYRLYMETDDCIACDKCARICPVDCITIESFKAAEDLGRTSDGTMKRLHLPVFDIDMAKCMYCGLCTTVCPTECLTMTNVYDYSVYDRDNLLYHFGGMSPEEEERVRRETEIALAKKKADKQAAAPPPVAETTESSAETPKKFVPKRPLVVRKPADTPENSIPESPVAGIETQAEALAGEQNPPAAESQTKTETQTEEIVSGAEEAPKKYVPRRPIMKKPAQEPVENQSTESEPSAETEINKEVSEQKDPPQKYVPRRPIMKKPPVTPPDLSPEPPPEPHDS